MDVEFYQGYDLSGDGVTAVANWPDGSPAIATVSSGGQKYLICGFSPTREATDWMVHPSFVPFVHQAVRWLASLNSTSKNWRVGDTVPLPSTKGTWSVIDSPRPEPAGRFPAECSPRLRACTNFPTERAGRFFAVNTPSTESDLTPWPDAALLARLQASPSEQSAPKHALAGPTISDEASESQQRLWWWLLAACGLGLIAEVALANRTSA